MLHGKSAVVTGSTSGIGLAIARALGAAGANVMLNGFGDEEVIAAIRRDIERDGGVLTGYSPADMTRPDDIHAMIADAAGLFGGIDILVNNAGVQHVAPVDTFPRDQWDRIIAINLSSAFHAIQASLPYMKARGRGRILNIASAHGLVASPYKSAYVAAKHGVVGLTKSVALETARLDITCNAVCPGYVLTPLVEKQIEDQARAHGIPRDEVIERVMLERQPSRRFVSVEQVAELCLFLCSDSAGSMTGSAYSIDGGWVAQ